MLPNRLMPRRPATLKEVNSVLPPPPVPTETVRSHTRKKRQYEVKEPNGTAFENDPHIIDRLRKGIEQGLPPAQAAVLAGISWRSFERYRQMARLGIEKYQPVEQAIREAQAKFSETCIKQIMLAGLKGVGSKDADWKALIRMLESLVPEAFKPKVDIELGQERDSEARRLLDLVRQEVGPEITERIVQRFLAEGGQGIPGSSAGNESGTGETEES